MEPSPVGCVTGLINNLAEYPVPFNNGQKETETDTKASPFARVAYVNVNISNNRPTVASTGFGEAQLLKVIPPF